MKLQSYIKKIDAKEVITCVLLIVVGYMTAQLFVRKYNGFRVGGQCPTSYKCAKNNICENISSSSVCSNSYYTGGDNIEKWCGYGKVGNKNTCHGTSNLVNNASCSKCNSQSPGPPTPGPPTPGPPTPTPTPGPPTQTPTPGPPSPTVSCSSTGTWTYYADKCLINGSTVPNQSYNDDCKKLTNCRLTAWHKPPAVLTAFIISLIVIIAFGGFVGILSGKI